ncbi:uncharacterized protein LOC104583232 [Brachypodium distachyon]|uniref:Uncharacterized protein n=1 Tax=Brachypodium distachyon TaxID=15368 RepID=A0A2K2DC27_BRADI|nr:uncharacterized protein LOC104583232 [Brachypodium distachyon]PNT71828.1 hypothetical protein BRADI_2g36049v3 [Brachypodium distachyon]|eukprot:XP_014754437.1 uncharacterized protein LOC104583232 [Brachypodium distachyon]
MQVNAFADEAFKGNPAAVCLLEGEDVNGADERWLQSVATEFNAPMTAFLSRTTHAAAAAAPPRFHIRWFSPVTEVTLCGHATLAAAHFLFTAVLIAAEDGDDMMAEFVTKSGMILAAKKVPAPVLQSQVSSSTCPAFIELDFPICT